MIKGPYTKYTTNIWQRRMPKNVSSFSKQQDEDINMNPEFDDDEMLQNGKLKLVDEME